VVDYISGFGHKTCVGMWVANETAQQGETKTGETSMENSAAT